ncbi:molybdate ABC transporter substrate-binding protein [Capilliphycus salinus ALCB114379]|uniref:molybdate ABC transporter substrate-binding protein n=1 Tax=Capilliphycus salinus TaxID=2768948 RepID=UPI0039A58B1E
MFKLNQKIGGIVCFFFALILTLIPPVFNQINWGFSPVAQAAQTEMIVSAAASLTDVMKAIQPVYQQQNSSVKLTYNFASSGSLQQQIEQGAPVDVFISAAPRQMNELEQKGLLLSGTRKDLLNNGIVLVVPKRGNSSVKTFQDLTNGQVGKVAIGEPESVPAGRYAKEVLTSMNMYDKLQQKLVFAKDVRQVLTYVEGGNVDAGMVYTTDAKISDQVSIVATAPAGSHSPIIYPVAVIKDSKNPEAAKGFISFLSSNTAKSVFERYGFGLAN